MAESYPNGYKTLWEKEKIACYEQFLLFPQCFQKACFPGASKGVIVWEWVNKIQVNSIHTILKYGDYYDFMDIQDLSWVNCWDEIFQTSLGKCYSITFFKTSLIKFLFQQSTNVRFFLSHNWIKWIKLKNRGLKHTHLAMFWNFCVGWHHDVNVSTVRSITS